MAIKKSIYRYDVGNVFRPNKKELEEKLIKCPRCKELLSRSRHDSLANKMICPGCGFEIEIKNVLEEKQIEEAKQKKKERRKNNFNEQIVSDIITLKNINYYQR